MQSYYIDGAEFKSLEEFSEHFSERVLLDHKWKGNLDALNDVLRGGFGTPEEGFLLVWLNSEQSRIALGYPETVRQLQARLQRCHPSHHDHVTTELEAARMSCGSTVFDWLVEIIQDHGPGGSQSDDNVVLQLR
jgi:RNAse (barnase) inhibitor barstar